MSWQCQLMCKLQVQMTSPSLCLWRQQQQQTIWSTAICLLVCSAGLEDVLEDEAPAPAPQQDAEEYFDEDDEVGLSRLD
jgi:hypothetical protein